MQRLHLFSVSLFCVLSSIAPSLMAEPDYHGPVYSPVVDAVAQVGQELVVPLTAHDADDGAPLNSLQIYGPDGWTYDESRDALVWVPDASQRGIHRISLKANSDGVNHGYQYFWVDFGERNYHPEVVFPTAPANPKVGELFQYQVSFSDFNQNDTVDYHLSGEPEGMTIDRDTGLISWTPSAGSLLDRDVSVYVNDLNRSSGTQFLRLESSMGLALPEIIPIDLQQLQPGESLNYTVQLRQNGGQLDPSFSLKYAPEGMSIDRDDGTIQWTPDSTQTGVHRLTVNVYTDTGRNSHDFSVVVGSVSSPASPVVYGQLLDTAQSGQTIQFQVVSESLSGATQLDHYLDDAPEGASITASGLFTWTPTASQNSVHKLEVYVRDEFNQFAAQIFTIPVDHGNYTPEFTTSELPAYVPGQTYQTQIVASDKNGSDSLYYGLDCEPEGATIDSNTGLITWNPPAEKRSEAIFCAKVKDSNGATSRKIFYVYLDKPNSPPRITPESLPALTVGEPFSYQVQVDDADTGDVIEYHLRYQSAGMALSDTGVFSWTPSAEQVGWHYFKVFVNNPSPLDETNYRYYFVKVEADDNEPPVNAVPVITSQPVTSVVEGQQYQYQVLAEDADNDPLTYNLVNPPAGMAVNASGVVSWSPVQADIGSHPIEIEVNDSQGGKALQTYTLVVSELNLAPQITSTPITQVLEGESYLYQLSATDPNAGDSLNFSLLQAPAGLSLEAGNQLQWAPITSDLGEHTITVQVQDQGGLSDQQSFTLTVIRQNRAPLASDLSRTLNEDGQIEIVLNASDEDGDSLTYSITSQPTQGTLSGTAPTLVYTPNENYSGSDSFAYLANDGEADSNIATVAITVNPVNDIPQWQYAPNITGQENQSYTTTIAAIDVDGDSLTYGLASAPAGMTIDPDTGLIEWLPGFDQAGGHTVSVSATDNNGGTITDSFIVNVVNTNRAPGISSTPVDTVNVGQAYQYTVTASDPDGETLTYQLTQAPAGMSVSPDTGEITWTPTAADVGEVSIDVEATDPHGLSDTQSFVLTVVAMNNAPEITSTPTVFAIVGDTWTYQLEATDPDGDGITFSEQTLPEGASFNPASGELQWVTENLQPADYHFELVVTDEQGLTDQQPFTVELLPVDKRPTHEGTDFWVPVTINHVLRGEHLGEGTFDINLVSHDLDTTVTIEYAPLSIYETLQLQADQITTYSINLPDVGELGGFSVNQLLENHAVHISAETPIAAYFMNQKEATTDGFVGFPVESLGTEYIAATYNILTRLGYILTVDGGQLGPIVTIVASEDNTRVTIDPIMDILPGGQEQIEKGTPIELILNRGDVYNLETKGSFKADLTGTILQSDKPIGVFGQMECTYVPESFTACDHLVEQMPPIETLGTEYYTVPFWGRGGSRSYLEKGDTFRIVAPFDNTVVYIDGVIRERLSKGEYFEFIAEDPQKIAATHPILVMQYSNGNQFDDGWRELPKNFADPFMVVVPPADQFLPRYTMTTTARDLAYNFANIVVPTTGISSVQVDGVLVDASQFSEITGTDYSFAQIVIGNGAHSIEADEPIGAYFYGYDYYESYGYLGGMAFASGRNVTQLELAGVDAQAIGENACFQSTAQDEYGRSIKGVRVQFAVEGVNQKTGYAFTQDDGVAEYCFTSFYLGVDSVSASINGLTDTRSIEWIATSVNLPPVITSVPSVDAVEGESYQYQVQTFDPEGDGLVYELVDMNVHNGPSIDESGLLMWQNVDWRFVEFNRLKLDIKVTDSQGLSAIQSFEIKEYKPFNSVPELKPSTQAVTGYLGVPYVFNMDEAQHSLEYLKYQIFTDDEEKDGVHVDIDAGPSEAYIQRIKTSFNDITVENDPRHCVGCAHFFRWFPETIGVHDFRLKVRDTRGGLGQYLEFSVDVLPNMAPSLVTFTPPLYASKENPYVFNLDVDNDVPLLPHDNLDDLRVVFEEKPAGMRASLESAVDTQRLQITYTPNWRVVPGNYNVKFHIADRLNVSPTYEYVLTVVDDNLPPVISMSMADPEVSIDYSSHVEAYDPEGGQLTYRLVDGPDGMSMDQQGFISWMPTEEYSGSYFPVRVEVEDELGLTATAIDWVTVQQFSNRAPEFVPAYRPLNAKVGESYTHQLVATDREGDYPISYRVSTNAPGASIDSATGLLTWVPDTIGNYWFSAQATDSLGNYASANRASWRVDVVSPEQAFDASLAVSPAIIDLGESATISVSTEYESTTPQVDLTVDGEPVSVNPLLQAEFTPTRVGRIPVTATIQSGSESVTRHSYIFVRDPEDDTPPVVAFNAPSNLATVTAPTDIIGTVQDDNLVDVRLMYKRATEPAGANLNLDDFTELYRGSDLFDQQTIGRFDPTMLVNGSYHILLQAEDSNGNTNGRLTTLVVEGDFKVGNLSFTVEDLNIPMVGLPISVTRTYDSRKRTENMDFGYGWSIDYQNVRVEENVEPTSGWTQEISDNEVFKVPGGLFSSNAVCIYPVGEKNVTVTLPNGDVEKFTVVAKPSNGLEAALSNPNCYMSTDRTYDLFFEPRSGTESTLDSTQTGSLYLADLENGYLAVAGDGQAKSVSAYRLTTKAGYVYELDQGFGIRKVIDPNGHELTYTSTGIHHSSGKSIEFVRDSQGRIEFIHAPGNRTLQYHYDADGDLTGFSDAVAYASPEEDDITYTYHDGHYLDQIIDPMNRPVVKNLYDEDGRLYGQENGDGLIKYFNHSIDDRTSTVIDLDGRTTVYNYDDRGNVLEEIKIMHTGQDILTSYTYDGNDNQETKTIGNSTWTTIYDEDNNLSYAEDPEGNRVRYEEYNDRGQETKIYDELNRLTVMDYDAAGNLTDITMPLVTQADGSQVEYSASNVINLGYVESTTDLRGNTTTYTYYDNLPWLGQKKTETTDEGGTITYTYDDNNNVETETRERTVDNVVINETVTYEYDKRDRLTKTIYPDNSYTETQYDLAGNVDKERDRFGVWTDYTYDAYGRLTHTYYADGSSEIRTYTSEGLLETVKDRMDRVTTYEYDDAGRLWKTIHPDDSYTEVQYTPQGWVQYEWDEERNLTEYVYDLAGRRTDVIRYLGNREITHSYTYYDNGELNTETDALEHTTTYLINELDQRVKTVFHNSTVIEQRYDAMGARTRQIDQNLIATDYRYDDLGRLYQVQPDVEIENQRVPNTTYTYDEVGNKLTQTDANGHTTSWTYDYFGRVLTRTLPEGQVESFVYNDTARTITHTDFNGDYSVTQNDVMGRVDTINYYFADGSLRATENYTYYDSDQVHTVTDKHGLTEYGYDSRDRLDWLIQPDGVRFDYDYDYAGNRTQVKVTRGLEVTTVDYTYDDLNRLENVIDSNGTTIYTYYDNGNLHTVTYPNGVWTEYEYNAVNQLEVLTTRNASNEVLTSYTYGLDNTGRRETITEHSGRFTQYGYDDLYRLTSEDITDSTSGNYSASYTHDWVGNRLTETIGSETTIYVYDDNDRLETKGAIIFAYDDNGNLTSEIESGTVKAYFYDEKNKLTSIEVDSLELASYAYNHNGIRTSKTEGGITTNFIVDENRDYAQVLQEIQSGAVVVDYTYGLDLISQERSGVDSYFVYDGLGSTRALIDDAGVVTDIYNYAAFGKPLDIIGFTNTTENSYLYAGEQRDDESDKYYLRARYMDPELGRFITLDTYPGRMPEPITLHKYLYANADPVYYTDPSGYLGLGQAMAAVRIVGIQATTAIARIGTSKGGTAIGKAIKASGAFAIGALVKKEVQRCYSSQGKKCRIPNLVAIGANHKEAQDHIDDAQKGRGSNGAPIPALVTYKYKGRSSSRWYMRKPECKGNVTKNSGGSCDEYPFAGTKEGGEKRYNQGKVSLRLINAGHNSGSGGVFGRAVRQGKDGDKYLVVPYGPASFYYSNGKFGM